MSSKKVEIVEPSPEGVHTLAGKRMHMYFLPTYYPSFH
jgi:hypothetical protein